MAASGSPPERGSRKAFPILVFLAAGSTLAVLYAIWARMELRSAKDELADARAEVETLRGKVARYPYLMAELAKARRREQEALEAARPEVSPRPSPPPPAAPSPPLPPPPSDPARLESGKAAFRAGRYAEAQVHFFRALPRGYVHLAMACLARGDLDDALLYLEEAMKADPAWLSLPPRSLFGTEEAYRRVLEESRARVDADPLDAGAKLLLAWLHYHEKGVPFAQALLTEITTAAPDHSGARRFLETLEK